MTAPLQYGTPPPSDPTAVMGRRTLAWLADLLLYATVVAAGFASMAEYTEIPSGIAEGDACDILEEQNPGAADACIAYDGDVYLLDSSEAGVQTLVSLGWLVLFVVLQGVTGGSPGKLLFGLRVVDQHGAKAGIAKSLGRTLMWVVDAAPWLIPLVGPITAFTSTGHRRVGDLAAGTYVVATSSVGAPVGAAGPAAPYGQASWGTSPPTAPPPPGQGWSAPTVHADPDLSEPTIPNVHEPATDWQPPTSPVEAPPPEPAPFAAPGAEAPPTPASTPEPEAMAPPTEPVRYELPPPQWDVARSTYIQWDPNRQAWLQWDTGRESWKPIDT